MLFFAYSQMYGQSSHSCCCARPSSAVDLSGSTACNPAVMAVSTAELEYQLKFHWGTVVAASGFVR